MQLTTFLRVLGRSTYLKNNVLINSPLKIIFTRPDKKKSERQSQNILTEQISVRYILHLPFMKHIPYLQPPPSM